MNARFYENDKLLVETKVEVLEHQQMHDVTTMDDTKRRFMPGLKSWEIVVRGAAADDFLSCIIRSASLQVRLDDGRTGECFPTRVSGGIAELKGTGPLK